MTTVPERALTAPAPARADRLDPAEQDATGGSDAAAVGLVTAVTSSTPVAVGILAADTPAASGTPVADTLDPEREAAISGLFDAYYTPLLRMATLLGADDPENVVAQAYYELYRRWRRLRDRDAAEAYLRSVVYNLTRMRIRHLQVARKHVETRPDDVADVMSAESSALLNDDQRALIGHLQRLPVRQREALVLRYWLGLREKEIAGMMGVSVGSVKTHTSRGLATLTSAMEARR